MVYANIVPSTTHRTVAIHHSTDATITLITYTLSTSILRTNKLIYSEAHPILAKQLETLKALPIRFELRFTSPISPSSTHPLDKLIQHLSHTLSHPRPSSPLPYPVEIALDTAPTPYWTMSDVRALDRLHRGAYTMHAAMLVQFHGAVPAVRITPAMRLAGMSMFEANCMY
ncbi:hypothetical protein HBH70_033690 [Parastagonospora nodorum]|nr:hypothetical protein HBH75_147790 [Parastagonospora nodorum]KAH4938807.1 hypothetical protein HBI79_058760 [Parastagonospora nodorum]KAH4983927.1 hypothetical protein HBI76_146430 [Parastagonospora nodorum]KAH5028219.1 hypothetical protein HBI74_118110 [Parastagonospora nodorum]KAH5148969.1 hypothetical protein HBH70_033690 [Parastagonospora nodorum]